MGWLGASPDDSITDLHSHLVSQESNAHFLKEVTPHNACNFYNNEIHLKKSYHYYHQVQLQLFVDPNLESFYKLSLAQPLSI